MRRRAQVLAAAGLLAAAAHLLSPEAGLGLRLATKAVPLLCLLSWVLARPRSAYARTIGVGLAASLLGDELLEFPGLFLPGLTAFLVAHLCYAFAFWAECRRPAWSRAAPFLVLLGGVYLWLWPGLGRLAFPVALYAAAFCLALWRASACIGASARGRAREWSALGGALLFAASDTLIGATRFVGPSWGASPAILPLYWIGQTLIATSVGGRASPPHLSRHLRARSR